MQRAVGALPDPRHSRCLAGRGGEHSPGWNGSVSLSPGARPHRRPGAPGKRKIRRRGRASALERGRRKAAQRRRRGGRGRVSFVLTREEFLDLFLDDLELPDLAKRRLAEAEHEATRRAGYSVSGCPRTSRSSVRCGWPWRAGWPCAGRDPETIAAAGGRTRRCDDAAPRGTHGEYRGARGEAPAFPYIDSVDIRYRRFESEPKPVAQAVMFCLMDVSGSMSEHMKDLAKRFYMLLYIFLTRRYSHVEIVFIRHTDRAEEVDEETFFRSPATGGTMVSSALEAMRADHRRRAIARQTGTSTRRRRRTETTRTTDGETTGRLLKDAILPARQYFAYLEVGRMTEQAGFINHKTACGTTYERLHADGAPLSPCARSTTAARSFRYSTSSSARRGAGKGPP